MEMTERSVTDRQIDELLRAVETKVRAHRVTVGHSLPHGRIIWRRDGKGNFEVTIQADN